MCFFFVCTVISLMEEKRPNVIHWQTILPFFKAFPCVAPCAGPSFPLCRCQLFTGKAARSRISPVNPPGLNIPSYILHIFCSFFIAKKICETCFEKVAFFFSWGEAEMQGFNPFQTISSFISIHFQYYRSAHHI